MFASVSADFSKEIFGNILYFPLHLQLCHVKLTPLPFRMFGEIGKTMKCKYCNEEMPERGNFCPICGGDNGFEPEIIIDPDDLMLEMDEMPEHTDAQANPVREEPLEASPALKRARLISVITGCIAGLAVLAVVLFAGISGTFSEATFSMVSLTICAT